jgi:hypothetical protein
MIRRHITGKNLLITLVLIGNLLITAVVIGLGIRTHHGFENSCDPPVNIFAMVARFYPESLATRLASMPLPLMLLIAGLLIAGIGFLPLLATPRRWMVKIDGGPRM